MLSFEKNGPVNFLFKEIRLIKGNCCHNACSPDPFFIRFVMPIPVIDIPFFSYITALMMVHINISAFHTAKLQVYYQSHCSFIVTFAPNGSTDI
jgi:hypothetical protein